jgi:hypothetical protein
MKSHATLCGLHIYDCTTNDHNVTDLKKILKENPQLISSEVDKSQDLIFLYKSDYHEKLKKILDPNFEIIDNYDSKR